MVILAPILRHLGVHKWDKSHSSAKSIVHGRLGAFSLRTVGYDDLHSYCSERRSYKIRDFGTN
jgi:hypothetical protein